MIASIVIGVGIAFAAVWLALGALVFALRSPGQSFRELLRAHRLPGHPEPA